MSLEVMKQALEALETCMYPQQKQIQAITSLRQAIEQAEKQEPVAWMYDWTTSEGEFIQDWTTSEAETLRDTEPTIISNVRPLYLHPAKWQSLTLQEHYDLADKAGCMSTDWIDYARAIEKALKEKNSQ